MGSEENYFRGMRLKLSLPVLAGASILVLYYWKLFDLNEEQILFVVSFLGPTLLFFLLWPIPVNRYLLRPVIAYLRGTGDARAAEKAAIDFPLRSALVSLTSWAIGAFASVYYSIQVFAFSGSYQAYLFMACLSAGFASSFIHLHLMRDAMTPIRIRIAEDTGRDFPELRYPILVKLLTSFTLLLALSTIFIALMDSAHIEQALEQQTAKVLQSQVTHWSVLLKQDAATVRLLPDGFAVENRSPTASPGEIVASSRIGRGRFLVARLPRSSYDFVLDPVEWEATSIILLTILIAGVICYFAAADISRPLNIIREKTKKIAQGDFALILDVTTDDEVAELAHSINLMTQELRSKMNQIQAARDEAQGKSMQLEAANKELMQLDELKSNFLANISHELKAPLVSTKGYVDFILDEKLGPVTEKQAKGLSVARDNLHHLTRLISSLLDFSKMSSGLLKLHCEAISIQDVIESCVQSVIPESRRKSKQIEFLVEAPRDLPPVYADPDRVREVLLNLLMNAEKFTESGGHVRVVVQAPVQEDEYVNISIIDNGIGIPEDHLSKIFQRFHQVDGSSTRKYGGTGLGLAIVKEILEAHGCKIQVESREGLGSKFTFTLPLHRMSHPDLRPVQKKGEDKHHASKLVEVVEDDPNILSILKMLLEEEGFAVIPARTGKDALRIAQEHRPDLITLDVYLPDVNGFDLLTQLQGDPGTENIPVIILSIVLDKEKGFRLGAADYLEKPIDADRLRHTVRRISDRIDGRTGLMKVMVVDDDESTLEFFEDCLKEEGYDVCTHAGGPGAIEIASREMPDLILLDLVMPGLSGLEVLKQMKSDERTLRIPVIMLTGKGRVEDRDQSIQLGAEEFITKPFELQDIVRQVKKYFVNSANSE